MEFIYCRRLNSQYFGAPKSGALKIRAPPRLPVLRGGSYATDSINIDIEYRYRISNIDIEYRISISNIDIEYRYRISILNIDIGYQNKQTFRRNLTA